MNSLETDLKSVVVYPDRARLTRQGSIELAEGSHQLEIQGLPVQMNPEFGAHCGAWHSPLPADGPASAASFLRRDTC